MSAAALHKHNKLTDLWRRTGFTTYRAYKLAKGGFRFER